MVDCIEVGEGRGISDSKSSEIVFRDVELEMGRAHSRTFYVEEESLLVENRIFLGSRMIEICGQGCFATMGESKLQKQTPAKLHEF
jgi:hypothetical protein